MNLWSQIQKRIQNLENGELTVVVHKGQIVDIFTKIHEKPDEILLTSANNRCIIPTQSKETE